MRSAMIVGISIIASCIPGLQVLTASEKPKSIAVMPSQLWKTRPIRRDTPLRLENISDREVSEVEHLMKDLYPGSVVYISAVTTGCPCHDGPNCTDQVWSVANHGDASNEIALSRIEGKWQIGPLQKWWLTRDRIWDLYRKSRNGSNSERRIGFQELQDRMNEHNEAFPRCEVEQAENVR